MGNYSSPNSYYKNVSTKKLDKSNKKISSEVEDFVLEGWELYQPKRERAKSISDRINYSNKLIISEFNKDPKEFYEIIKSLGKGACGEVFLVKNKTNGIQRAMKVISYTQDFESKLEFDKEVLNEINILRDLDHPNIIKIFEFYIWGDSYYLIQEYCPIGNLAYITVKYKLGEHQISYIMFQVFMALNYVHKMKIVHRDLKPENILVFKEEKGLFRIKICDFGTSTIFQKGEIKNDITGTLDFMAPEVIKENYSYKCDLWSCGVIFYYLYTRKYPFYSRDNEEIVDNILYKQYDEKKLEELNPYSRDIVKKLLERNPEKRITAYESLNQKIFKVYKIKEELNILGIEKINKFFNNLKKYKFNSVMQETAIAYLVHNYPDIEEVDDAVKLFNLIDKENNGRISINEFIQGINDLTSFLENNKKNKESFDFVDFIEYNAKYKENKEKDDKTIEEVTKIFESLDKEKNNYLEYEEFIKGSVDRNVFMKEDVLKFAFSYFDKKNENRISIDDIKIIFNEYVKEKDNNKNKLDEFQKIIDEVDENGDGIIDFKEFSHLISSMNIFSEDEK